MATIRDLELNSGMRCVKCMLLIVTIMFALTAILLMIVGTTIQVIFGDFRLFLDDYFLSPPNLLIAIGFIMLFVATLGAYGVIKESVLLVNVYAFFLFIVLILEVSAAICAFVMQGEISEMLQRTMNHAFGQYESTSSDYIKTTIDYLQADLQCCGVNSRDDWRHLWSINQDIDDTNPIYVPDSCCGLPSDADPFECEMPFEDGCYPRMNFIISQSTMLIATGATTVAFVQFLCVLCAFMLVKTLRRNKSIRAARRWQLQQSLGIIVSGGKVPPPMCSSTGYTQLEESEQFRDHDPITYTPSSPSVN